MKPAKQQSTNISLEHHQAYSGPIPDPESLARYEQIQPGFPERIVKMAEDEALHRRSNENRIIKNSTRMAVTGIVFAFIAVLVFSGIIVYAISQQSNVAALSTVVAALASLAGVFVFFRNKMKK